jgi:hypothetical protein
MDGAVFLTESNELPCSPAGNFRLYWLGQIVSLVGTWMQSVAQGWLMHRLAASAFLLGLLGVAQFLNLLFSLWAGSSQTTSTSGSSSS